MSEDLNRQFVLSAPVPIFFGSPLVTPWYLSQIAIFLLLSPTMVILENRAVSP